MKKLLLIVMAVCACIIVNAQSIKVTPNGLLFSTGEKYLIVENEFTQKENMDNIVSEIKSNCQSPNIKVEQFEDKIFISDFVAGYTKTDKNAGSAYLLDFSYKISIDVKDGKIRINLPIFEISSNQKYDSHAVVANKGVQFSMSMGIKGKSDIWNSKNKALFIFNEKDKLIEKTTKDKLEKDFSSIIDIVISAKKVDW